MIETLNKHHETVNYQGIEGVRLYHNIKTDSFPPHWHEEIEVILPLSNYYNVKMGLSGEIHSIYKNDIIIISPCEMHTIFAPPHGERLIININLNSYINLKGLSVLINTLSPYRIIREKDNPELSQELQEYLLQIEKEYNKKDLFCDASIYSYFSRFLVTLGRTDTGNVVPVKQKTKHKVQYAEKFADVCYYINEHYTESLNVEDVAAYIGFSKFHFCRLFNELVGCTFHNYVINCQLSHAQRLLSSFSIPITDIALQSGFSSLPTFNRIFKERKQCSPSEYRKMLQNNMME
jgi:AraC-type DNA-binding domain-containing proteins